MQRHAAYRQWIADVQRLVQVGFRNLVHMRNIVERHPGAYGAYIPYLGKPPLRLQTLYGLHRLNRAEYHGSQRDAEQDGHADQLHASTQENSSHLTLYSLSSRISNMETQTQPLQVPIKRIDKTLPLPTFATAGSVGFDLFCREDTEIAPRSIELIPANVIVKIPEGYMLLLTLRSSTPRRKKLLIPNGVGIIDQDYCGEGDELKVQVLNFSEEAVMVNRGERIAQGIFVPIARVAWSEVDEVGQGRGGFGSTGL